MSRLRGMLAAFLTVGVAAAGCANSETCDDVRNDLQSSMSQVCGDPAYAQSPFCAICVKNEFYAIDDSCVCRPLTLDTNFCFSSRGADSLAKVRAAIDLANASCSGRTAPQLPYSDAAVALDSTAPEAGGDTTATEGGSLTDARSDVPQVEAATDAPSGS